MAEIIHTVNIDTSPAIAALTELNAQLDAAQKKASTLRADNWKFAALAMIGAIVGYCIGITV